MERKVVDFTGTSLTEIYGQNCFSDVVLKSRLPKSIYKEFKKVQNGEMKLTLATAEVVAGAMKDWAIEKGATHFTHWFQPLTGLTAEKHDSFISPTGDGGVLLEFSGKELVQGEPDASSFPNGGLRSTFEARGYTAWDTTSPAFLKEDETGITLYIPTAFISYTGEALDKKVPLLRSMEVIEKQTLRVLNAIGTDAKKIITTVGPEQEYFLVDAKFYEKRPDLILAGRTVFGSMPSKGQEMDDHYFGTIKDRVHAYMRELDYELWKLGVSAKTKHNEVAPNQFELASIYTSANVAVDNNHLVMDLVKRVAARHGLVALLHEKPFAGVNGSGKHNNWALATENANLLEPGSTPHDNAQFLLFLSAVIKAVDEAAGLLRSSAANSGNDHRLGANEAPPAVISIFLGELLTDILQSIAEGKPAKATKGGKIELGVDSLPTLPKDLTDRNRTSPFAFTGNKFEFRMPASSDSISGANVVLNTAVADVLSEFADKLEKSSDINATIKEIIALTYKENGRILFNGNGYSDEWLAEAEKRGLANFKSTVDVLPELMSDYSVNLFEKFAVLTKDELESRYEIYLEKYSQQLNIEASLVIEISNLQILPAASKFAAQLAKSVKRIKSVVDVPTTAQETVLKSVVENLNNLKIKTDELEVSLVKAQAMGDSLKQAQAYRDILGQMDEVRVYGDALELIVDKELWPLPKYEDLLFNL